jgi:hypothetical protein
VDGGSNYATGNAEPAQCFGIVCTIGVAPGAPDTTIVDRPTNPTNSRNALFTFIGADDTTPLSGMSFECRLDSTSDLAWIECDNPQAYLALSPGTHLFEVRAVDVNGLVDPSPASYTWTYVALPSGVAPDTTIVLAPGTATPLLDGYFTFTANEPDVTFQCSLDGAPFAVCEFAFLFEFEETQIGPHTFQVRAIDFEGNIDPTPATYNWTITGVATTITSGPAFEPGEGLDPPTGGETVDTTATFNFFANVADAAYLCSLDLSQFAPCAPPVTYTGLAVGEHQFRVFATDPEGEFSQIEPTVYEWTVVLSLDVTPPNTTITAAPANNSSETTFAFTGTDDQTQPPALTFECRLDSALEADFFGCISPFNLLEEFPEFAPGVHTFEVRAIDNADPDGNIDPTPASHTWTAVADSTPPDTAFLTTPPTTTVEIDVEFTFAGSDATTPELLLTFECSLDGAAFAACDSPESVQGLLPGVHEFQVRAVDLALNADPTPAAFTWTVIGPPETTIQSGPLAVTTETTATFVLAADQINSTFACALDGAAFAPCASPLIYEGLANGIHALEVQAINAQGLIDETPAVYEWTVEAPPDTTPPDTTIVSGPLAVTLNTTATFTFAANEPGATFECALNGGAFGTCTTPHEITGLAIANHTLAVRAIDFSGNVDPTPASYAWTVDGPPLTTITAGPPELTDNTSATFTFSANEPATFECWLDGAVAPCASPVTYTGLAVGEHIFAVRGTDLAGNVNLVWEDYEWEIVPPPPPDTTPPATLIDSGPAATTTSTSATFAFSATEPDATFTCSLNGAAFST